MDDTMDHEILEARLSHDEIVHKYNRIASVYDMFGILMESRARRRALEVAAILNGEKILEVALGTGLNFAEVLNRNPQGWVEGVDVSIRMLEKAKKRVSKTGLKNYILRLCDCRHLPFKDGMFDVLMSQYMFDILPVEDFVPILSEFNRVLKQRGRIVLVNTTKGETWFNQVYEMIYKLRLPLVAGARGVLIKPFLERTDFVNIRREFVSQLGFPSEVVCGIKN